jgi:hypothetical protein
MVLSAGVTTGGAIFDANVDQSLRFATVAGDSRILDGPVLSTFLFHLYTRVFVITPGPWNMEIGLVPDPQPEDFSTVLLPWERDEVSLGVLEIPGPPLADIAGVTQETLTLDAALIRAHVTSRSRWNGRVAFSFRIPVGSEDFQIRNRPAFPFEAVTTQDAFFRGFRGGPSGARQRFVRDSRYGMPALNTELVRDGDNSGLWVRPWDSDPEDEPARYRPRPGEGTVDDDIPG